MADEKTRQARMAASAGSPMMRLLGVSIVKVEPGSVIMHAVPKQDFANQAGTMHGGYSAALLDNACGAAAYSLLDEYHYCATLDLNIVYLRRISRDTGPLEITGMVRKEGHQVSFAEAVIRDAQGRDLATATSTLIIQKIPEDRR